MAEKLSIDATGNYVQPTAGTKPGTPLTAVERDATTEAIEALDAATDTLQVLGAAGSLQERDEALTIMADVGDAVEPEGDKTGAGASGEGDGGASSEQPQADGKGADNEEHLVQAETTTAALAIAEDSDALEDETQTSLKQAAGMNLAVGESPEALARGAGVSAARPCKIQHEQSESEWLKALTAALAEQDLRSFCQALIDIRADTQRNTSSVAGMRTRTLEEADATRKRKEGAKNRTLLQDEQGNNVDPSTLLRQIRKGKANKYFTFRKNCRLLRWRDAGEATAGSAVPLAGDQTTVQAGEIWLALDGPNRIIPVVIICANERIAGGLRPEVSLSHPVALKNAESISLHIYGEKRSTTATQTIYGSTGMDYSRESRVLLHKVSGSRDTADDASIDHAQRILRLDAAAMTTLKKLAADKKMKALWKIISPGKKPLADGSAGARKDSPPILDSVRAAVAAAAARALTRAADTGPP